MLIPAELGRPDATFFRLYPPDGSVALVYGDPRRPRAVLTQYHGRSVEPVSLKVAGPETRVELVTVGGAEGVWLEGAPHLVYTLAANEEYPEPLDLAGNVLIWERGGRAFRLEADVDRERALEIAESLPALVGSPWEPFRASRVDAVMRRKGADVLVGPAAALRARRPGARLRVGCRGAVRPACLRRAHSARSARPGQAWSWSARASAGRPAVRASGPGAPLRRAPPARTRPLPRAARAPGSRHVAAGRAAAAGVASASAPSPCARVLR